MADDNKPMKYMRYAIGEIVLVVVGILIALSINNWNEKRKDKEDEIKVLFEIRNNLISGISVLDDSFNWDEICLKSGLIILNHISKDLPYNDSLNYHFLMFPNIGLGGLSSSGFQSLKSKGLKLIQNDSIRIMISNLYDNSIPQLLMNFELDVFPRREELYNTELYTHFLVKNKFLGDSITGRIPNDYNILIKDIRFESMVRSFCDNRRWFREQKEFRKNEMTILIESIDKELEN